MEEKDLQKRKRRPAKAPDSGTGTTRKRAGARRRVQRKRRRQRNLVLSTVLLIILILAAIVGFFLWNRYSPSKEQANLNEYYGIESEGQLAVIVDNQIAELKGKVEEGRTYVRYETVRDLINQRFYWDPNENILLYTLPNDVIQVPVGSKEYQVSKEKNTEDYVILKTEGSTAFIALDFVKKYTNMDFEVFKDPERVVVNTGTETKVATVKRKNYVRFQAGVKSPYLTEVAAKDTVTVIEALDDWQKVRTKDGYIGYIKQSLLNDERTEKREQNYEEPEFTSISKNQTINMAWHNVTNAYANNGILATIANTKGLTTISPTWFHVKDTAGNIDSIADTTYVNYCHQSNIEVWAALRDFDGGISSYEQTLELLKYTSRRENLINQLIAAALQSGIDGINLDFEMVSTECGEHYIQFVRELSVKCRQNGLVFSVDNYVPKGHNTHYNRAEQGVFADYVIIMGYDEHWGGSPVAGPVASIPFVREGIEQTLKEVPAEKVINAMPFYTRLWMETPKTAEEIASQEGTEAAEYATNVTSEAYGMADAQAIINNNGAQVTFDEANGVNFATWEKDGTTYKIWPEDEVAIEAKLKLMKEYHLAGVAAWSLGQEDTNIWNLIIQYTN